MDATIENTTPRGSLTTRPCPDAAPAWCPTRSG
jgi:hypothetical protein